MALIIIIFSCFATNVDEIFIYIYIECIAPANDSGATRVWGFALYIIGRTKGMGR